MLGLDEAHGAAGSDREESEYEGPPKKRARQSSHKEKIDYENQVEDSRQGSDMVKARSYFFNVLYNCKEKLGGLQSEAFKELYIAAKMWQAQEDLMLS